MKWLALVFTLFSSLAFGQQKTGRVICSVAGAETTGFELVKFRVNAKTYRGEHRYHDRLFFAGSYSANHNMLSFEVFNQTEEFEKGRMLFSFRGALESGNYVHFKVDIPTEREGLPNLIESIHCQAIQR